MDKTRKIILITNNIRFRRLDKIPPNNNLLAIKDQTSFLEISKGVKEVLAGNRIINSNRIEIKDFHRAITFKIKVKVRVILRVITITVQEIINKDVNIINRKKAHE